MKSDKCFPKLSTVDENKTENGKNICIWAKCIFLDREQKLSRLLYDHFHFMIFFSSSTQQQ